MQTILAIESATNACSVALQHGDSVVERYQVGTNLHSQVLLQMVAEVVSEAGISINDLAAVAVGQGPGSFTGLRIGIGVAQGLAYGANCKMLGVSSLAALAWQAINLGQVVPDGSGLLAGIDARMNEIYCAEYMSVNGLPELKGSLAVLPPEQVVSDEQEITLVGNAWAAYWPRLNDVLTQHALIRKDVVYPHASAILALGHTEFNNGLLIDPREFRPDYIRDNVAKKAAKRT